MKEYKHPGTNPPSRTYCCIGCGHLKTIKGVWSPPQGRWYMAFTCDSCGAYQSAFVSEARSEETRTVSTPYKEENFE